MKAYQIISRMALMATASAFALAIAPVSFDGLSANVWHKAALAKDGGDDGGGGGGGGGRSEEHTSELQSH